MPKTPSQAMMLSRNIPSSGEQLPVVGCGTWQTFDSGTSPAELEAPRQVLERLFASGGSVIDTSPMYGRAEQVTGEVLANSAPGSPRFLATKVWTTGRRAGIKQMEHSFRLLKSDVIDLMQIHNLVDWRTHLPVLKEWKAAGRLRYIGVTHYTDSAHGDLEAVLRSETFDFVQLNYSLLDRAAERRLLPAAQDLGVAVLVNRPLGEGTLVRRLGDRPLPEVAKELGCGSWSQLALKYIVSHPAVTCIIPATSNPEHMKSNARAGFGNVATDEQRRRISEAL